MCVCVCVCVCVCAISNKEVQVLLSVKRNDVHTKPESKRLPDRAPTVALKPGFTFSGFG